MKKLLLIILGIVSITLISATATAASSINANVIIYEAPKADAKVIEKINPGEKLVGIYHHGDWIKVGDVKNGQVGWVNRQQYQTAMNNYFQSNIQTMYIHTASNGKGESHIVAYENGKKLSDKDAKKLYDGIRKQQIEQARYMQQMFWNMQNVLDQQQRDFDQPFDPSHELNIGFMPAQPIIVINSRQK